MAPNTPSRGSRTIPDDFTGDETTSEKVHRVYLTYEPPYEPPVIPQKPKEWWRGGNPKRKK